MHIQKYKRNEFVQLMMELARLYHPKVYVEIGVAEGHTFRQMMQLPCIGELHAVDINPMPSFAEDGVRVFKWQMSSKEFAAAWNRGPIIDMLFIDGDHSAKMVEHDFFQIGRLVRAGTGLILLHDTHPMTEELLQPQFCHNAWKFADELYEQASMQMTHNSFHPYWNVGIESWMGSPFEVITLPGPWAGITLVKRRGPHHLCWKNENE